VVLAAAAVVLAAGVVLAQGAGDLRVPVHDPERVQAVVHEVLSRPEFRPPERSLVQRVYDWVLGRRAERPVFPMPTPDVE